jgi:hypothetical protein
MAHLRGLTTLVAGMLLMTAGYLPVEAQSAGLDGAVYRGNCERLADPVSDLTPAVFGSGEHRGNRQAIPATSFFATIPLSLDALLANEHAVAASDPDGEAVACGEIGGTRTAEGALFIGLRAEEGSGITGIAYLAPGDEVSQSEVSLLIAGEPLAEITNARTQAEDAYASDLMRITQSMIESFSAFADLTENARFGEDDWMSAVGAQIDNWDSHYDEALALNPPPVFAETHALLVEALRLYGEAGDDFFTAFDTRDRALVSQAVSTVAEADELFRLVMAEVERIRAERGE